MLLHVIDLSIVLSHGQFDYEFTWTQMNVDVGIPVDVPVFLVVEVLEQCLDGFLDAGLVCVREFFVHQFLAVLVRVRDRGIERVLVFLFPRPPEEPVDFVASLACGVVAVPFGFLRIFPEVRDPTDQVFPVLRIVDELALVEMLL